LPIHDAAMRDDMHEVIIARLDLKA